MSPAWQAQHWRTLSGTAAARVADAPVVAQQDATSVQRPGSASAAWLLLAHVAQGGLAPAAELLQTHLSTMQQEHGQAVVDPQLRILQTELELLLSELRLAQGRGQLQQRAEGVRAIRPFLRVVSCLAASPGSAPAAEANRRGLTAAVQTLRAELALLHQELSLRQRSGVSRLPRPVRDVTDSRVDAGTAEGADAAGGGAAEAAIRSGRDADGPLERQALAALAMSQLGQDLWVLERTGGKRGGFFVEFGATDGVLLSNTWLLEQRFGWRGLCAEPNPGFYRQLQANRHCTVSAACIGAHTGDQVAFVLSDAYGGSLAYAHDDQHGPKRDAYRDAGQVVTLETISLDDFLKQHQAPREIDYISIDTEGSEYEILSAFPFDDWQVQLFTIEHNFTERRQDIRRLMEEHGYVCTEAQWDDWYERKAD
ncbi:FkbM family methyltransferase [Halochromatium roseum]|uniref:FkbM family methyltransferase n=1 Tax=Halochromatium roseum TaxID=391920 RepID=UPI0019143BA1